MTARRRFRERRRTPVGEPRTVALVVEELGHGVLGAASRDMAASTVIADTARS